jgi:signal transduction histidine kinase
MGLLGDAVSGLPLLDGAVLAVSFFNTFVLLWLGLTVLLNAERPDRRAPNAPHKARNWGLWLAGGGLLLGAAFFISHSAILGIGLGDAGSGLEFWWQIGWAPVIALPLIWYVLVLWYAGFWERGDLSLRRRQRAGLFAVLLLAAGLVALMLLAHPVPPITAAARQALPSLPQLGSLLVLALMYPVFCVACVGLSVDALGRPGPSARMMGDLASRRARPWLIATSLLLLAVSLLVAALMFWTVLTLDSSLDVTALTWFDLIASLFIAASTVAVGQAIIAYEVFTGKVLPRRGFFRHWNRALVLATGYSIVLAAALSRQLRPVYGWLLGIAVVSVFYALATWRLSQERDRTMAQLRPFVASQRLYEQLLSTPADTPLGTDGTEPFHALCADVLGVRLACLVAVGPLAPLSSRSLVYPAGSVWPSLALDDLRGRFSSPDTVCVPLPPELYNGAQWAVPLWSDRGLIGVCLLGEKADGGLYTQEEMEIARASGERLLDTQAGAELARRLVALQRQRWTESQLLDRRTRRTLHDEILPQLHAALLSLNSDAANNGAAIETTVKRLSETHGQIAALLRELPPSVPEVARLGLIAALQQMVSAELPDAFDGVSWQIEPEAGRAAKELPVPTAEVLFYAAREAMRNAARHARTSEEEKPLHLCVKTTYTSGFQLTIEDDGVGIGVPRTDEGGSRQGLALHSTMMAIVGGTLAIESAAGQYTRVVLTIPA